MNYDILWILYFFVAGLLLYFVFDVDLVYVVIGIAAFELAYYVANRETWSPVRRYIYNLFYGAGYILPSLFLA